MKKALSIILTVVMLVSMLPVAVFADTATPITTAQEFLAMQADGAYYLENDIDLGEISGAYVFENFSGTLDGYGKTVSFSIAEAAKYTGLIGHLTGTVKNLVVDSSIVLTTDLDDINVGAIAGFADGNAVIDSCYVNGNIDVTLSAESGKAYIGGVAGVTHADIRSNNATISNTRNGAQITVGDNVTSSEMEISAGGITGRAGKIKTCVNMGAINVNTTDVRTVNAGGIAADETGALNIDLCANYGLVSAKAAFQSNAGGIAANVGKLAQCIISRSSNFGNIVSEITGADINNGDVNNEDLPNIFAVSGGIVGSQYKYAHLANVANYAGVSALSPDGVEHFENRDFAAGISGKAYSNITNAFDMHTGTVDAYYSGPVYATLNDSVSEVTGAVRNAYYVAQEQYNMFNATEDEADLPVIIASDDIGDTSKYEGFNFTDIWEVQTAIGYPTIRNLPFAIDGDHTHVYSEPVYNDDHTCTTDGTYRIECECGLSFILPAPGTASGHKFENYVYNNDATHLKDGTKTAVCENGCGETDTVVAEGTMHVGDGWFFEEGNWMYYINGAPATNVWIADSQGWCYLGADGRMVTNSWIMDSQGWCYLGDNGYCVTNAWVADSIGWCYLNAEGRMATNQWIMDSQGWCFVGDDGYCITNQWVADSIGWCYLNAEGRMATNQWIMDSQGWCYVGADGYCITNAWMADSIGWCYLDASGRMVTNQWIADSQGWYWLDESGYWDGIYY